jgi:hypothetical protein
MMKIRNLPEEVDIFVVQRGQLAPGDAEDVAIIEQNERVAGG